MLSVNLRLIRNVQVVLILASLGKYLLRFCGPNGRACLFLLCALLYCRIFCVGLEFEWDNQQCKTTFSETKQKLYISRSICDVIESGLRTQQRLKGASISIRFQLYTRLLEIYLIGVVLSSTLKGSEKARDLLRQFTQLARKPDILSRMCFLYILSPALQVIALKCLKLQFY